MIITSFCLLFASFFSLSVSLKRHYLQLWPQKKNLSKRALIFFRALGYSALVGGATLCVLAEGLAVGLVLCMGLLTLAALLQSLLLTYCPQWIVRLCLLAGTVLVLSGITGVVS